jgi:hypothetical protein
MSLGDFMLRAFIAIFSAGWLFPLWVSANSIYTFFSAEVLPRLRGEHPLNSFPFLQFSQEALIVALIWLAAVITFWSWRWTAPEGSVQRRRNQRG